MTDRELLELAAKAAGITLDLDVPGFDKPYYINERGGHSTFNPLEDDGDALRLAVKIGISPDWEGFDVEICRKSSGARNFCYVELHDNDPYSATRKVIVEAAAAIGKQMK